MWRRTGRDRTTRTAVKMAEGVGERRAVNRFAEGLVDMKGKG